jgi:hypothetical protein
MKTLFKTLGILSTAVGTAFAGPADTTKTQKGLTPEEYGAIYVLEQKDTEVLPWKLSLGFGLESGNPYLDVSAVTQNFERSVGRFTWVGIQATEFMTSPSQLMNSLRNELSLRGFSVRNEAPSYAIHGTFTAIPFSGHMTFFGDSPMQTELQLRVGAGRIAYQDGSPKLDLFWSIRPTVYLSKRFSTQFGITQSYEGPFSDDSLARLRADLNVGLQF